MRLLLALSLLLLAPLSAGAAPAAAKRSEALVAAFQQVKSGGALTAADRAANERVFAELDPFFDFDALSKATIEPRKERFSPAQLQELQASFRDVLRLSAYPDSGTFFRKANLTWEPPVEGAAGATVVTVGAKIAEEGLETRIGLHWKESGGALRVVDVSFDGDSLVRDYQNQFGRIVDKDGVPALLGKLRDRKAQLVAERPAQP